MNFTNSVEDLIISISLYYVVRWFSCKAMKLDVVGSYSFHRKTFCGIQLFYPTQHRLDHVILMLSLETITNRREVQFKE